MTKRISAMEMVATARSRVESLSPDRLAAELRAAPVALADLREWHERELHGMLPGAFPVPRGQLEFLADPSSPRHMEQLDPNARIVLYCSNGDRSALAASTLLGMGFHRVAHLEGGFDAWIAQGFPHQAGDQDQFSRQ